MEKIKYPINPPTSVEVLGRCLRENQSPRWWVKEVESDHHGNEWYVVTLRVFDSLVHVKNTNVMPYALLGDSVGWEVLAAEPGAFYWVPCEPPSPAGVE